MKLLLIQPPIEDFYETDIRLQPIGLAYLKGYLKKMMPNLKVKIVDFHQGYSRKTIKIPPELMYLKNFYPYPDESPFCTFHHYFRFGASEQEIESKLREEKPNFIGISSLFSPYYREALAIAEISKRLFPLTPVIFGGSHVSACPEQTLGNKNVDYIIQGEGEIGFYRLLEWLMGNKEDREPLESIGGLGYKNKGQICLNKNPSAPDLFDLPYPDLSDFNLDQYRYEKKPMCFVITSRSCPHHCSFCSVHTTFGNKFRRNKVENILEELQNRYDNGYRVFDFEDDNLTFFKPQMKELCLGLIKMFPKKDVECVAMNGISYLSLDEELLRLMKEAGFTKLNLALVSSDQTVLNTTKRPHTIEKYLEVVKIANELGFEITSYQILGLPFESIDSMIQTLCFASEQPVLLGASPFYLTPNSPIAKKMNLPLTEQSIFTARLTAMNVETEHFKRNEIYSLFVTIRIINFIKSLDVSRDCSIEDIVSGSILIPNKRVELGIEILSKLLKERVLYAHVKKEFHILKEFKFDVFKKVMKNLRQVPTQNGKKIWINQGDGISHHLECAIS